MEPAAFAFGLALVMGGLRTLLRWRHTVRLSRDFTSAERSTIAIALIALGALLSLVATSGLAATPNGVDVAAHNLLGGTLDHGGMRIVLWLSYLGEWRLHVGVMLVLVPLLRRSHGWPLALHCSAILCTGLTVIAIKHGLGRARPSDMLLELQDRAFPSGHAAMGLAFWFAVGALLGRDAGLGCRALGVTIAVGVPSIIGWTRLFLRVHWLSDVIGGFAIALFWGGLATLADCFAEHDPLLTRCKKQLERTSSPTGNDE